MLINLLSHYASRLKGGDYQIDTRLDLTDVISLVRRRLAMKTRGYIRFPFRGHRPFIGSGVRIRARGRIKFGGSLTIDDGAFIDATSVNGVRLGHNVSLGRNSRIECTGNIQNLGTGFCAGDNVGLGTDNLFGSAGGIKIGRETIIGNYCSFHSENHNTSDIKTPIRMQGVTRQGIEIGEDCWIGSRVTILDGVTTGRGCIFAAGSVVRSGYYEDFGIYAGVPAKLVRFRDGENGNAA
ncbi:acyltransferase [Rhodococcus sp. JVH1]|uniref:acyltransferase n=1 Tax=Rhodococcus sp. JVH1 TaxID=745408 RepID=UPI0007C4A289